MNSDYVIPLGNGDLTFNLGATGKGSRIAASLSETVAPVLKEYVLVNSSLTYSINNIEIGAFVTNLLNEDYMESYIEKTTLILARLPPTDIGIPGDKRRYGIRTRIRF